MPYFSAQLNKNNESIKKNKNKIKLQEKTNKNNESSIIDKSKIHYPLFDKFPEPILNSSFKISSKNLSLIFHEREKKIKENIVFAINDFRKCLINKLKNTKDIVDKEENNKNVTRTINFNLYYYFG